MRLKFILLFLLVPLAKGQPQMTPEEQVVRTTYAKLSYADEVRIIMRMEALPDKFQADERAADKALASRLEFQLSDFKTGPVSEIEGRILSEISGFPPEGDTTGVLLVAPGTFNYKDNSAIGKGKTEWTVYADVSWNMQPQHLTAGGNSWPMATVLKMKEMNGPYDTYATYTVTVTFQGKSRTYNTAALFGTNADGANVHFLDLISGNMTLDLLAKTDMSTAPFSKTDLRDVPFIHKWLNSNRQQGCGVKGHGDVCCNPETKKCGVGTSPASRWHREFRETSNPYLVLAGFHPKMSPVKAMFQTSCSSFNVETFYNHGNGDVAQHTNGQHTFTSVVDGTCVYSAPVGSTGPGTCNSSCSANANGTPAEFGSLNGFLPHSHVPGMANKSGQEGNTPTTQCQGTNAISFMDCTFANCTVTVSINGAANGVGAVISFANASLWNDNQAAVHNCPSKSTAPSPTPTPPPPQPTPTPCDPDAPPEIRFGNKAGGAGNCDSPIIIDLTGDGFQLTSAANGVKFDIANAGIPLQIAWTANANNAWLVLDRNGNGVINSGAEMFGNFTSQPSSLHPNGFAALAVFDDPANGGNGDGVIDARDTIFSSLRLWVDANHDGICQPGELHALPELGVYSISLDYALSERRDQYGNLFRYRARVNQGINGSADIGKTAYDVFLVAQ
ncbi:MAG TPA: hypothetical protein VGK01_20665 [Candidatus Angelobacter sp.]|jgi:hypothetical protein